MKDIDKKDFPILFVDDDVISHKLITKYLEEWNLKLAFSGKEALEIIKSENIQIVITDISMPGMDGLQLLKEIKTYHGTIQVIMLTSLSDIENLISSLGSGANDFLIKPVAKEELEDAVFYTVMKIKRWKNALKELFQKKRAER